MNIKILIILMRLKNKKGIQVKIIQIFHNSPPHESVSRFLPFYRLCFQLPTNEK